MQQISGGITAPSGFRAAGIHCGIKKTNQLDLALVVSDCPGPIAGLFTTNRIVAAPVALDRAHLRGGVGRAFIINSGCANVFTGRAGMAAAQDMASLVASRFSLPLQQVFVGSTGVIGGPLPIARIRQGFPTLVARLRRTGGSDAARAIMTTDTRLKQSAAAARIGGRHVTIGGMAKGAGMIHPNMATMLAYLATDAVVSRSALQQALRQAADQSFNCISIDGDTSTNDTVLCLANGLAGNRRIDTGTTDYRRFGQMLAQVCRTLALQICRDGEGVTKCVEIIVRGTRTDHEARRIAETVATSALVKTALFGEDANWGRIIAAIGRAGVAFQPNEMTLTIGGRPIVSRGHGLGPAAERRIAAVFRQKEFTIEAKVGKGPGSARMWTTDLSYDYVRINASYRS